jgi:prepilin peptidase CpaA
MTLQNMLSILFAALLIAAAIQDMRSLRISNLLVVAVLAVAIARAFIVSDQTWWEHLASFAITLAAGTLLFSRGWMGGGDAKLLAAASAWFGLAQLAWYIAAVAMLGGVLTLILLPLRRLRPASEADGGWRGLKRGRSIPYGVAIAAGALATAWAVQPSGSVNPAFDSSLLPRAPGES